MEMSRATRGSNTWRQHVEEQCFKFGSQQRLRGELERVCPERVQRNHHRQKGKPKHRDQVRDVTYETLKTKLREVLEKTQELIKEERKDDTELRDFPARFDSTGDRPRSNMQEEGKDDTELRDFAARVPSSCGHNRIRRLPTAASQDPVEA